MEHETKTFRFAIKELSADAEDKGTFRGYLSVFNNVDAGGDVVQPGAFKRTLDNNKAFPLLWAHSAQEPGLVVGTFHGGEDKFGLHIDGEFFLDHDGGRDAYDVVKKLHERGVKVGLSIGYRAVKWENVGAGADVIRNLKEIELFEGSLTLFPMNDQALVQAVKDGKGAATPDLKGKVINVVCSDCGRTVMEIMDPAAITDKALDAQDPADATPANDPPPENEVAKAFLSLCQKAVADLNKI